MDIDDIIKQVKKEYNTTSKTTIPYWISTGSTLLDYAICNGLPGGRLIELSGKSSTGKSAMCFSILANAQKQGGIGILLDSESSFDSQFASVFGVDCDKLIVVNIRSVEDIFNITDRLIKKLREETDKPIVVCADSCTPSTKEEFEKSAVEELRIANNAKIQRRGLRKLLPVLQEQQVTFVGINHLVANPLAMPGQPREETTGGTGWKYFPHLKIKLVGAKKLVGKVKESCIGISTKAVVAKSKVGVPFKSAQVIINYATGLDDVATIVDFCNTNGVFGSSRGWLSYTIVDDKGDQLEEKIKWRRGDLVDTLRKYPEAVDVLRTICRKLYSNTKVDPTETVVDNFDVEDELFD